MIFLRPVPGSLLPDVAVIRNPGVGVQGYPVFGMIEISEGPPDPGIVFNWS